MRAKQGDAGGSRGQLIAAGVVAGLVVLGFWYWFGWRLAEIVPDTQELRGQFGDQFGAANSLVSSFTLIAVIVTVLLQRIEARAERDRHAELLREARRQTAAPLILALLADGESREMMEARMVLIRLRPAVELIRAAPDHPLAGEARTGLFVAVDACSRFAAVFRRLQALTAVGLISEDEATKMILPTDPWLFVYVCPVVLREQGMVTDAAIFDWARGLFPLVAPST